MTTLAIIQLVLAASGPVLAALAHYRLNRAQSQSSNPPATSPLLPATPPGIPPTVTPLTPHLGDGHIIMALLNFLSGVSTQPQAPVAPTVPNAPSSSSDLSPQLLALLGSAQQILADLAKAQSSVPTSPATK